MGYIRDGRAPIPKKESTSRVMQANKAKNTKPEVFFRRELWSTGLRGYRLHPRKLPGKPDITFSKEKLAIFVNGCFWHRCPTCNLPLPKSNPEFWQKKFDANIARDQKKIATLSALGWETIIIWECSINCELVACLERVERALQKRRHS